MKLAISMKHGSAHGKKHSVPRNPSPKQLPNPPPFCTSFGFLRLSPKKLNLRATTAELFEGLSVLEVEEILRRAYADVLIDNIQILREYLRPIESTRHAAIVRGLERIRFLPARAILPEFLSQTRTIFAELGW